jgi:hypothetical protein
MAQIEVKVKLDLPPGVELLGYERCGDGHGFEVKTLLLGNGLLSFSGQPNETRNR